MNPVHRIYQGWGEYAGFDGHFSVVFNKKIETYGTFADGYCFENTTSQNHRKTIGVYVGFPVKAGEEILVKVASSFVMWQELVIICRLKIQIGILRL